jgi:hypothetical protein
MTPGELKRDNARRWRKRRAAARGRAPRVPTNWTLAAFRYVDWLAKRDGIQLPEGRRRVEWQNVAKGDRRIRAVSYGNVEVIRNKKGWVVKEVWKPDFEFVLPHWDWQPQVTEEDTNSDDDEPQSGVRRLGTPALDGTVQEPPGLDVTALRYGGTESGGNV